MKNAKKTALLFLALVVFGAGTVGCVKVHEDETIEVIHRPQIDIEPDSPGWDDGGTEHID